MAAIETTPEYVQIFDTTLRDGEQSPGIALSEQEKLQIAQQLGRLGVDIIEAGFPINSPAEFKAVEVIAQQVEGPVIAALARVNKPDIDRAASALRDSETPRIHTFISSSDIHLMYQLQTTREDVKGQVRAGVAHAKSYVDDVEFSPMDATRTDVEFVAEVCEIAIEEGATVINIPDTVGYTFPSEFDAQLRELYQLLPALGGVILSVHCHQDLGLAVANSLAGVQAGARQVECAVNGIGERAGNASLEEIVMLLRTRRNDFGFDTRINTPEIGPTSRMVAKLTGYPVPRNKAVVGSNAFKHEAGIHQDGMLKERTTYEIMQPEEVGVPPTTIVLGKHAGRHAVRQALEEMGSCNEAYLKPTLALVQEMAGSIGVISGEQVLALHEEAERRQSGNYTFEGYDMQKKGSRFWARVGITKKGHRTAQAGEAWSDDEHSKIDGAVSALFDAIKVTTGTNYALDDYSLQAIGQGQTTPAEVTVVLRLNDRIVAGKGVATDTLDASAWAYLHALSKVQEL